jgi:hypothetical protein
MQLVTVRTAIDKDTPLEAVQEVLLSLLLVKTYFLRLYLKQIKRWIQLVYRQK